jgi:hypothetical protein
MHDEVRDELPREEKIYIQREREAGREERVPPFLGGLFTRSGRVVKMSERLPSVLRVELRWIRWRDVGCVHVSSRFSLLKARARTDYPTWLTDEPKYLLYLY